MMRQFNLKYILGDWETGQSAAGTTAGTATQLTADHNWVGTVTSSARGVKLKQVPPGNFQTVTNADSADALDVYPWTGANFNGAAANDPYTLPAGTTGWFLAISNTKISAK